VRILKVGSRGPEVRALQEKLNVRLVPSPRLVVDGAYGGLTQRAVRRFQKDNWLVEDGEAGPCTQNALFGAETYRPILHAVPLIPQPTKTTCWAASTAMMTRSSVAVVIARTPPDLIASDGGLKNFSNTDDAVTSGRRFAQVHGLQANAPMSWSVGGLRSALARGPLMFDMLWDASGYTQGIGSPGHMIVVIGMRGDDDPSGGSTTLRIHDPWKPTVGGRYSVGYFKWIQEVPTRTYRVFEL
jgi:hypothetical protein